MNDTMSLSQRADALEVKMARGLGHIIIKSPLPSMADNVSPGPNAGMPVKANPMPDISPPSRGTPGQQPRPERRPA